MRLPVAMFAATMCLALAPLLSAQDAAKVDPKHYTVLSENEEVRILKAHYGPHEKSVMHSHPAGVAVFLTDVKGRFSFPDGKSEMMTRKAGDALYTPSVTHLPENLSDKGMDVIVIEFKKK